MQRPTYLPIGTIRKPFGTAGAVAVNINDDIEDIIFELEHFFVFIDGQYLPYFIEEIEEKGDLIVKLDIINSPQVATTLSGKKIFVTPDQVSEDMNMSVAKFGDITGYQLYNNDEAIGHIEDIIEYPSQLMIKITYLGKGKLLPLVDSFLVKIDDANKSVYLTLPEGILEL